MILVVAVSACTPQTRAQVRPIDEIATTAIKKTAPPLIVIDPGHGGKDLGAKSPDPHIEEKALNLQTALLLNQYLQRLGYQTILTRGDDFFVPLKLRADFANSNQAALFVSVHYNSAPSKTAEGVEVFFYDSEENPLRTNRSKQLAQKILDRIIARTQMKSRGVKNGNFAVIRETKMPAVLVEGGFMTNDQELNRLRDPAHMQKMAESIAHGVRDYLNRSAN
jgi:N-acetylmuramoyl-L-alanine amidase